MYVLYHKINSFCVVWLFEEGNGKSPQALFPISLPPMAMPVGAENAHGTKEIFQRPSTSDSRHLPQLRHQCCSDICESRHKQQRS